MEIQSTIVRTETRDRMYFGADIWNEWEKSLDIRTNGSIKINAMPDEGQVTMPPNFKCNGPSEATEAGIETSGAIGVWMETCGTTGAMMEISGTFRDRMETSGATHSPTFT